MFKSILLPVDLNDHPGQARAIEVAIKESQTHGASLHVITVVPDFNSSWVASFFPAGSEAKALSAANEQLHAFMQKVLPEGMKVQHIVAQGTAYREILRYAGELKCDLIVMASHRPELQDYLLGPNAARVVRHAACSVMVVRPA